MIDYKKEALKKLDLPDYMSVHIKKNRKENRYCDKCNFIILKGEVYFCEQWINSYWVDESANFHLECITHSDIVKMGDGVGVLSPNLNDSKLNLKGSEK